MCLEAKGAGSASHKDPVTALAPPTRTDIISSQQSDELRVKDWHAALATSKFVLHCQAVLKGNLTDFDESYARVASLFSVSQFFQGFHTLATITLAAFDDPSNPHDREFVREKKEAVRDGDHLSGEKMRQIFIKDGKSPDRLRGVVNAFLAGNFQDAIRQLFDQGPITADLNPEESVNLLTPLMEHWKSTFEESPLVAVKSRMDMIRDEHARYYCRHIHLLGGSGSGKSRIMNELSWTVPMFQITMGASKQVFPPPDTAMAVYLCEKLDTEDRAHARALALVYSIFTHFATFVRDSRKERAGKLVAAHYTDIMAPTYEDTTIPASSNNRRSAMSNVAEEAGRLFDILQTKTWCVADTFRSDEGLTGRVGQKRFLEQYLLRPAKRLLGELRSDDPTEPTSEIDFGIFIDETHHIQLKPTNTRLFDALKRVFSCLTKYNIYLFTASNSSGLDGSVRSQKGDASGGANGDTLKRSLPFISFPFDGNHRLVMRSISGRKKELEKPLSEFAKINSVSSYGRFLWGAFKASSDHISLNRFAMRKLLGAQTAYNSAHSSHVFAALGNRVYLTPLLSHQESPGSINKLTDTALRQITAVDLRTEQLEYEFVSEPVMAGAVAATFCEDGTLETWTESLVTLAQGLVSRADIDEDEVGKLYARILLILSRDRAVMDHLSFAGDNALIRRNISSSPYFSAKSLLNKLLGDEHVKLVWQQKVIEQGNKQAGVLLEKMNTTFTHFMRTTQALQPSTIRQPIHKLLARNAALVCCLIQLWCDLVIPLYGGDFDEKFNEAKVSAIFVKVNNCATTNTYEVEKQLGRLLGDSSASKGKKRKTDDEADIQDPRELTMFDTFQALASDVPVIFLQMDLRIEPGPRQQPLTVHDHTYGPQGPARSILGIHLLGGGLVTYGCQTGQDGAKGDLASAFEVLSSIYQLEQDLVEAERDILSNNLELRAHSYEGDFGIADLP